MKEVALITGASSGIGRELARIHASKGKDLVIIARGKDALLDLKTELETNHQIKVELIVKDLSLSESAKEIFELVKSKNIQVDYLINNAGFGGHGFFHERDWKLDKSMIMVNVAALTALTRYFLPEMVMRNKGKILNLASVASFAPGPLQAVYFATKSYVLSFSEAIANELGDSNITVTALCPGPTESNFTQTANASKVKSFQNLYPLKKVAAYGYDSMEKGTIVAVYGLRDKFLVHFVKRFIPRKILTRLSRNTQEMI